MEGFAIFTQVKLQAVFVLLLSLILSGLVIVYRQQAENRVMLDRLLAKEEQFAVANREINQIMPVLKDIQAKQVELAAMLNKLAVNHASQTDFHKIPASKMKKFKHGGFKPAKATGY